MSKKHVWKREGSSSARWIKRLKKSFDFVSCLLGFVEAKKFRDSSEYSDCVQTVWANRQRVGFLSMLSVNQKIFAECKKA